MYRSECNSGNFQFVLTLTVVVTAACSFSFKALACFSTSGCALRRSSAVFCRLVWTCSRASLALPLASFICNPSKRLLYTYFWTKILILNAYINILINQCLNFFTGVKMQDITISFLVNFDIERGKLVISLISVASDKP